LVGLALGMATDDIGAVVILSPGDGCVGAGFCDATWPPGNGFGGVFSGAFFGAAAGGACFFCAAFFLAAACFFVGLALPLAIFEFMAMANKKVGKG
jgi:hypothetical protein